MDAFIGAFQGLLTRINESRNSPYLWLSWWLALIAFLVGSIALALSQAKKQLPETIAALVIVAVLGLALRFWSHRQPGKSDSKGRTGSFVVGLAPIEDRKSFLGRENESNRLRAVVGQHRFIFVTGDAGAGKTSLLRASVIPGLQEDGWSVLYVDRSDNDPLEKAGREAMRQLALPHQGELSTEIISKLSTDPARRRVVLILDQFEETLVANPYKDGRKPIFAALSKLVADADDQNITLRVIVSLRREFVDGLRDGDEVVPKIDWYRFAVELWSKDTFRDEILGNEDFGKETGFSGKLKELLADDLADKGGVLPARFQLVALTLVSKGIKDEDSYRALGGAEGILGNYIQDALGRAVDSASATRARIGGSLLRELCDPKGGLTRAPAVALNTLKAGVVDAIQALPGSGAKAEIERTFDHVLDDFESPSWLLVTRNNRGEISLTHDYLVPVIREVTSSNASSAEIAAQALRQYAERAQTDKGFILPFLEWLRLGRRAGQVRSEPPVARLLRRATWFYSLAGVFLAGMLVLSSFLFGWSGTHLELIAQAVDLEDGKWAFNNDSIIVRTSKAHIDLLPAGASWPDATRLDLAGVDDAESDDVDIRLSKDQKTLLAILPEGPIRVWTLETKDGKIQATAVPPPSTNKNAKQTFFRRSIERADFSENSDWLWFIENASLFVIDLRTCRHSQGCAPRDVGSADPGTIRSQPLMVGINDSGVVYMVYHDFASDVRTSSGMALSLFNLPGSRPYENETSIAFEDLAFGKGYLAYSDDRNQLHVVKFDGETCAQYALPTPKDADMSLSLHALDANAIAVGLGETIYQHKLCDDGAWKPLITDARLNGTSRVGVQKRGEKLAITAGDTYWQLTRQPDGYLKAGSPFDLCDQSAPKEFAADLSSEDHSFNGQTKISMTERCKQEPNVVFESDSLKGASIVWAEEGPEPKTVVFASGRELGWLNKGDDPMGVRADSAIQAIQHVPGSTSLAVLGNNSFARAHRITRFMGVPIGAPLPLPQHMVKVR